MQIRDLHEPKLLFEYLEVEIKCQYALQIKDIIRQNNIGIGAYYNESLEEERIMNKQHQFI